MERKRTRSRRSFDISDVGIAMGQVLMKQAAVGQALAGSSVHYSEALFKATQQLHKLSLLTTPTLNISNINPVHPSWLSALDRIATPSVHLESIAKLALSDISYDLIRAERVLRKIDFDVLGKHLNIQLSITSEVQRSVSSLLASYGGLAKSFQGLEDLVQRPSFVLPGATRELSTTGYALEVLYPLETPLEAEDVETETFPMVEGTPETIGLVALLEKVGPEFVRMYMGAWEALDGNNSDRKRHVLTSLRELWNHILRKLAPKETVNEWIVEHGYRSYPGYLHNGNPTRRAKMRYVLKDLSDEPLEDFVEADITALVKLYDLYGRLHDLNTGVTNEQLRAIFIKTESSLAYLLRVRESP